MSNLGISNSNTSQFNSSISGNNTGPLSSNISNSNTGPLSSNITNPGPTGVAGDMKKDPVANPNISQNDVGSTQHVSREIADVTNTGTKAFENKQVGEKTAEKAVDPEQQKIDSAVARAVISHNNLNSNANPSITANYGK